MKLDKNLGGFIYFGGRSVGQERSEILEAHRSAENERSIANLKGISFSKTPNYWFIQSALTHWSNIPSVCILATRIRLLCWNRPTTGLPEQFSSSGVSLVEQ